MTGVSPTCFLKEMPMCRGKLSETVGRMSHAFAKSGNQVVNLFPSHGNTLWATAEDILRLEPVQTLQRELLNDLFTRNEFQSFQSMGR